MNRAIIVLAIFLTGFLGGCGPQTIWLRPSLDTPSQHVANGNQLLKRGKLSDACREFRRAREIDPNYTMAYIGLGIALGKKGDVENGLHRSGKRKCSPPTMKSAPRCAMVMSACSI